MCVIYIYHMERLTKECRNCKEVKSLIDFNKDKRNKDGLRGQCKVCVAAKNKAYRQDNAEKVAVINKAWYQDNKEKVAAYHKAYHQDNAEKVKAYKKAWRQDNKEKANASNKAWRQDNPEKVAAKNKAYHQENKEKEVARAKAWYQDNKDQRIEDLCRTFGKGEKEVNGTIYHFQIGNGYKIGKAINGFQSRYGNIVKDEAVNVTEWVMNVDDMHAFEKVILHKTKAFQYEGVDLLWATGNREIRTVNCEETIDLLIAELNIDCEKVSL